jgi:hypothetical protein
VHSSASVRVLSVSDHESIRSSREMLLQSIGYMVVSMSSECALRCEIPHDLAIAVIGQTTNDISACRVAGMLREIQPNIRILRLTMQYSRSGPGFDACCFVEDGPEVFLTCVAELIAPEVMDEVGFYSGSGAAAAFRS